MKRKIGINGFGRIGRNAARVILGRTDVELVAINSGAAPESHAYLLSHDSVQGTFSRTVTYTDSSIGIDGNSVSCFHEKDPSIIPWQSIGVETVLECTGKFTTTETSHAHMRDSVTQVVISAPAKDDTPTFVMGVNHQKWSGEQIVSNSSCTTNCIAPVLSVLDEEFGVIRGSMTTVHAATDSQNLLDNSQPKGIRDRRSALVNLIPATSGSAKDVAKLFPHLKGVLPCRAVRVPTPTVSLIDLVVEVSKSISPETVNAAFERAKQTRLHGILDVAAEELVSTDYIGNPHSAVVDPFLTDVVSGTLVHVTAWYDNEWGYANRLVDMAVHCVPKT